MARIPYLTLNDGNKIPQLGLGVFSVAPGIETERNVALALKNGYRHIDTAHAYENEISVGKAIRESGIPRDEIFITTKIWPTEFGIDAATKAVDGCLERLGMDYVDLMLLHWPLGDYIGAWHALEQAVKDGKIKSIGLSNFSEEQYDEICECGEIIPAVNQVESHPKYPQHYLRAHIEKKGTLLEAWYPLGHGDQSMLNNYVLYAICHKYGKTPAQIVLRWHIQERHIIFPRATKSSHMIENLRIFDFELTDSEMHDLGMLNTNQKYFNKTQEEMEAEFLSKEFND